MWRQQHAGSFILDGLKPACAPPGPRGTSPVGSPLRYGARGGIQALRDLGLGGCMEIAAFAILKTCSLQVPLLDSLLFLFLLEFSSRIKRLEND